MSDIKQKSGFSKFLAVIVIYAIVLGTPLAAYFTGSTVLASFASAALVIWGIVCVLTIIVYCLAFAAAYLIDDNQKRLELYEALCKREFVYYIGRVLAYTTPIVLIGLGYVGIGVWYIINLAIAYVLGKSISKSFEKFKESLAKG